MVEYCYHFINRRISDLIREINDPEHPLTLEELHVVQEDLIEIDNEHNTVNINFTPTIPHCSMATLIGLSIRVKLLRCLPARFKVSGFAMYQKVIILIISSNLRSFSLSFKSAEA